MVCIWSISCLWNINLFYEDCSMTLNRHVYAFSPSKNLCRANTTLNWIELNLTCLWIHIYLDTELSDKSIYPSSTFADPNTSSPPDLPLAHKHSWANRYAKTIRTLACNRKLLWLICWYVKTTYHDLNPDSQWFFNLIIYNLSIPYQSFFF